MCGTAANEVRQITPAGEISWSDVAQSGHTQGTSGRVRFFPAQIVFAACERARLSGFRHDERKTWRKWDSENLLAAAVEENRVISAAEKRNHLIEQARLHADVAMLGALTRFRNFQRCKLPRKQFEEKERSRELKRRRAGQSRADRDIAGNFRVKSIHRHA